MNQNNTQWNDIKTVVSKDENVLKYVFSKDTAVAESVLYKYPTYEERTVMCISTQSGCPVGCRFCGAGDNFVRSLTAEEIVAQPRHLFKDKGIDPAKVERGQIMVMSMGEPLLNLKNLVPAFHEMYRLYPKFALLISTIGPRINYDDVIKLSQQIPTVGLQFSVHESTDDVRDNLIPFKAKLSLAEIAKEGERWFREVGRKPFFNYCAHEKNSSVLNADQIRELLDPDVWEATISVICERDESIAAANERQRELAVRFRKLLGDRGFSTRVFDPAGQDDVGGGCGQLWFVQSWMKEHPELARPSIGRGLPVVHTPRESCCSK
jgi:23S rRNA (adenine2503-C2)-methyltransferase